MSRIHARRGRAAAAPAAVPIAAPAPGKPNDARPGDPTTPAVAATAAPRAPLAALQAFAEAARLGSFKLAAEALYRTPSAVSHQVRSLEAALGQPLFVRGHRTVALTPAGRTLARRLQRGFGHIHAAWAEAQQPAVRVLGLSMAPGFAATYVLPRLAELQARVPGWRLDVESTGERADLAAGRIQVAVRFGPPPRPARDSGVEARLLRREHSVAVGAPALFDARGRLVGGFERATLLGLAQQPAIWSQALKSIGVRHRGHVLLFDALTPLMEAAEQGLGLALSPASVLAGRIAGGRLRAVPGTRFDNGWGYWLLMRTDGPRRAAVQAVAEWLASAATTAADAGDAAST